MLPHPTLLFTLASCVPYSLNLDGYTLLFRILGICLKLRTSCFPFSRRLFGNVCELAWKIVKQCLKCINVQFNIVYQQAMVFSQRVNKFLFTPLRIISLNCLLLRTCCVCYPRPSWNTWWYIICMCVFSVCYEIFQACYQSTYEDIEISNKHEPSILRFGLELSQSTIHTLSEFYWIKKKLVSDVRIYIIGFQ